MTDITERLRDIPCANLNIGKLVHAAADEIDRLRARVAELEAARGEPGVWLRDQRGSYEGPETLDPMFYLGAADPGRGAHGATYSPFYPAPPVQARGEPHRSADIPRADLLDKSLREYAHKHRIEACSAWSDVKNNDGSLNEAKCNYASAQEAYLKSAIDELADLSTKPAPTVDVDAISDEAILRTQREVWAECGRDVNAKLIRTVVDAIFNKGE